MKLSYARQRFNKLAGKGTHQHRMLHEGDRILVGVSGGKDSLSLVTFLSERLKRIPINYHLIAVHIDQGYDDPAETALVKGYLDSLGLESIFLKTDYAIKAHSEENQENPCFLCSRLRRKKIFDLARDYDCSKVALGHNRDDLIETLLLNIFYSGEISTMLPVQSFFNNKLHVIRPLAMVPESLIKINVKERSLPVVNALCPTAGRSKREEVKKIIADLRRTNNKVPGNIYRSLSNYRPEYLLTPDKKTI